MIKNLKPFDKKLNFNYYDGSDIIILPEMFTTGFTMDPEKTPEEYDEKSLQWMLQKSKKKKCVIIGSISGKHRASIIIDYIVQN